MLGVDYGRNWWEFVPPVGATEILSGGWQQYTPNCFFVFSFDSVDSHKLDLVDAESFVELNP